ncbi:MAG: twin transmembrane helix small protein [Halofilum sp. (in: g-proteobacteria)]|nr:twin transmembrane helix small protein [Halofilum sp. (in: g-proteobacteria)]
MLVKIIVVVLLLVIIGSLVSGLFFMLRDDSDSDRMVRALTWRIGLSIAAFALLIFGAWMGWIDANPVYVTG